MTLSEYFTKHKPRITYFARDIGLPVYTTVYKWLNGEDIPSKKYMIAIQRPRAARSRQTTFTSKPQPSSIPPRKPLGAQHAEQII
jgi:hypothetical protein